MAQGKIFNEFLVHDFLSRHANAENASERGAAIRWFMDHTGVSTSAAYTVLRRARAGFSMSDIAGGSRKRKPRKSEIERAQEKRDAITVSAIKKIPGEDKSKWIPTEYAMRIASNMGLMTHRYTRSTMDRILAVHGLNKSAAKKRKLAHRITAEYPMQVVVVDATPMDQYYIQLDGKVKRYDLPEGDTHQYDLLVREGLYKIWVYYGVDLFSKSFLAMPFASLPKGKDSKVSGENSDDWFSFLKFFFLPKYNLSSPMESFAPPLAGCPIQGLPEVIYCDRGSGIGKSNMINETFGKLCVKVVTHMPKNPSAKGMVEGRISAFKRSFETQLIPRTVDNINQLLHFYFAWADWWNKVNGHYTKFREGLNVRTPFNATEENFRDANIARLECVVDGYGCVNIAKQSWFVTWDEQYRGERILVFRHPKREGGPIYSAMLPNREIVWLTEGRPSHPFGEIKSHPESEGSKHRKEATEASKKIRGMMMFTDTLPPEKDQNVIQFPTVTERVATHSPAVPPSFADIQGAMTWLCAQTGLFYEHIPEESRSTIEGMFKMNMDKLGFVPGDIVVTFSNLIIKNIEEAKSER